MPEKENFVEVGSRHSDEDDLGTEIHDLSISSEENEPLPVRRSWSVASIKTSSWFFALELLAIAATIGGLGFGGWSIWQNVSAIEEAKRQNAWQVIATESPGNSGKTDAIELLAIEGVVLDGIDVSCERMGGELESIERPASHILHSVCRPMSHFVGLFHEVDRRQANSEDDDVPSISLRMSNFSSSNLEYADLSHIDFFGSNFSGSELINMSFQGATLHRSNFTQTYIDRVDFSDTAMSSADFSHAIFLIAFFRGADLRKAIFESVDFGLVDFSGLDLRQARFNGSRGAEFFENANLVDAEFIGANLSGANFKGANLSFATFVDSYLTAADFSDAITERLSASDFQGSWAIAGYGPVGLPEMLHAEFACTSVLSDPEKDWELGRTNEGRQCVAWADRASLVEQ